jgi:CRP/FNR family transcriptional regulator, anaerobic regulatory protein
MARSATVSPLVRIEDSRNQWRPVRDTTGSQPRHNWLNDLPTRHVRARRGEVVVYRGERSSGLHVIRCGSCKSVLVAPSGLELVAGYHIAGDVLGVQTVLGKPHEATIVALEDSEVVVVSWDSAKQLAARSEVFRDDLWHLVAHDLARQRDATLMLGVMRAEQRLAWFVLDLADRFRDRGYSSSEFTLRMTREDIGSRLGLTQETISRLLRRFHREGLLQLHGRVVKVIDRGALRDIVDDTA